MFLERQTFEVRVQLYVSKVATPLLAPATEDGGILQIYNRADIRLGQMPIRPELHRAAAQPTTIVGNKEYLEMHA
jgi:hypothetical protein